MTGRGAIGALAGGLGVAAGVLVAAIVAAVVLVALGSPPEGRAGPKETAGPAAPSELVIALSLGDPVMQGGVVRDGRIVLARGFEVEVARALARRLRAPKIRFVDVRPSSRLVSASAPGFAIAIASVRGNAPSPAVTLSIPYLATDQAVVPRRGLPALRTLADLRSQRLCATRGSDGAQALTDTVRPRSAPMLVASRERLLQLVQTGLCDAALVDGVAVGGLLAGRAGRFGDVVARVEHGPGLVVAVSRAGGVPVADVDRALRRLRADGTLHRLARAWLRIDPARLRALR